MKNKKMFAIAMGANDGLNASKAAVTAQRKSREAGIAEQRRQLDISQENIKNMLADEI